MKKKFSSMVASIAIVTVMMASLFVPLANAAPMTGTLHILKYSMDDVSQAGESTGGLQENGQLPANAVPLAGVIFEVSEMTPADGKAWGDSDLIFPKTGQEAIDAANAGLVKLTPLTTGMNGTNRYETNQNGQIDIPDLNGYYLVREVSSAQGVKTAVEPFVVSVPMVDPTDNATWLEDVYVYPKNELSSVKKTVDGGLLSHGENPNTWKITTHVPNTIGQAAQNADAGKGYFHIVDQLDPNFVHESGSVKVTGDKSGELIRDHHYEVIEPSADNNNTMTVKLKKEGMEQLANGDGSGQDTVLSVEFRSSMADDYDHNVSIHNNAQVFYSFEGDPDNPDPPTEPTDKPFIFDGMVGFIKVAADEDEVIPARSQNKKPLEGAYFQIAASEADALNGNFITRNGIVVKEQSDASGVVRFKGLKLTPEFDVSGNFTGFVQDSFWAVEVQAPDGYNLVDGPIKITIDAAAFGNKIDEQGRPIPNTVELKNGQEFANVELSVVNTPSNSRLVLPKTGGMGTLMFTAGGIALIGVAVVLLVVYRKKTKQN